MGECKGEPPTAGKAGLVAERGGAAGLVLLLLLATLACGGDEVAVRVRTLVGGGRVGLAACRA
eukprot:1136680-Pelagomonas_calceolata.AAC.3